MKETVDRNKPPKLAISLQFDSIDERPSNSRLAAKATPKPLTSLNFKQSTGNKESNH